MYNEARSGRWSWVLWVGMCVLIGVYVSVVVSASAAGNTSASGSEQGLTTGEGQAVADVYRFDFGPGPTADGYTKVSCTQSYSAEQGYGWDGTDGVDGRDRSSFDMLRKDFCFGNDMTYRIDLADGWYRIKLITGDEIAGQGSTDVFANDEQVLSGIQSPTGSYAEEYFLVPVTDGQLRLKMVSNPARLNALEIARAWKLDVGPGAVQDGYTDLSCKEPYSSSLGYGWENTPGVNGTDQPEAPNSLFQDYCFGHELSLVIDVAHDTYEVTIVSGDEQASTEMTVYAEGEEIGLLSAAAGEYASESFVADVNDGQLNVEFAGDPARVNGLYVLPQMTFGEEQDGVWPEVDGVLLEDHGSSVTLTNSEISFTLNKSNPTMSALRKRGAYENTNLLQHGRGYYLLNYVLDSERRSWGGSNMSYELVSESDASVEISLSVDNPEVLPFTVDYRFVLQKDTPGLYMYSIFKYPEHMPDRAEIEQSRYSFRANPDIFTHFYIDDASREDRNGEFPAPADIRAGETLMDATVRLPNGEVYTKYNHSVFIGDNRVNAMLGEDIALSLIRASDEYVVGGPYKQEYFMEQTTTTPMLHWYEQVRHYGVPNVVPEKGWQKVYGPFFLYVNEGEDTDELWDDILQRTEEEQAKWPYEWVDDPLYAADSRAEVSGRLTITDGSSAEGARVILGDGNLPVYEQNLDYLYDVRAGEDGQFTIPHVRPGTYSLYADVPHLFGGFQHEHVHVTENGKVKLGELEWIPDSHGETIWQIGEPDRTARQFKYGDELRQWGLWLQYPFDFDNGVDFVIGESDERKDWNYLHPRIVTPGHRDHLLVPYDDTLAEWRIHFNYDQVPNGTAVLTISVAAADRGSLVMELNDTEIGAYETLPPIDNDAAVYRSGEAGYHRELVIPFAAEVIEQGENTIRLRHMEDRPSGSTTAIMYDALKLEIETGDGTDTGIPVVRAMLHEYAQKGEVRWPLYPQLNQRLNQAAHHDRQGRHEQAVKHLRDFQRHLHHPHRQSDIDEQAKQELEEAVQRIIAGL